MENMWKKFININIYILIVLYVKNGEKSIGDVYKVEIFIISTIEGVKVEKL